jgi:hypothetical protein
MYRSSCLSKNVECVFRARSLLALPVVEHQNASLFRDQSSTGQKYATEVDTGKTIGEFKEALATLTNIPAAQQRLIYKGRVLKDEQTVDSYGRRREKAHGVSANPGVLSTQKTGTRQQSEIAIHKALAAR